MKKWAWKYEKVDKTYRLTYKWDISDISDSCDGCNSCDSSDSNGDSDSNNSLVEIVTKNHFFCQKTFFYW